MDFDLSEEQRLWRSVVHDFVLHEVRPHAKDVDENAVLNWDAVRKMGALGLLGLNVPEQFGGAGMDMLSAAIAIEELGWACGSTALSICAHNGLGCNPIVSFGNQEQKERFLPAVVNGQGKLAALALTEPGAGSDLKGGVRLRAIQDGGEWVINGSKMWCTNASAADYILTLARTDPSDGSHSLSIFIVPTETSGLQIGPSEKKMGLKGSPTNPIAYQDVRVPAGNLLGEEGDGMRQSLATLDRGRIGIGAISVGLAQAAMEEAARYAKERQAFGSPISEFQAIQWMLADMATQIEAARTLVHRAAWLKDQGKSFTKQAAMAKLFASEVGERVCRDAIQIHGGYGYSREYPLERMYRDARLMTIGEGTSEVQRLVIARHVLREM
jgi:alkylation response protein AidB-like acyl-CoA dehydrogenase